MAAPWTAPLADSPAAVGLKNGGLSEITQDIIYPASRLIDGDFSSGRSLEFRFRSDSSRHWLPRESRMLVEYDLPCDPGPFVDPKTCFEDPRIAREIADHRARRAALRGDGRR